MNNKQNCLDNKVTSTHSFVPLNIILLMHLLNKYILSHSMIQLILDVVDDIYIRPWWSMVLASRCLIASSCYQTI